MFYGYQKDRCILGDSIPDVLCQLDKKPSWNLPYLQALLQDALWLSPALSFQTHFQEVFRIPVGYQLENKLGQVPKPVREWQLKVKSPRVKLSLSQAQALFTEQLIQAIKRVTPSDGIGIELSGGLDSSTVSALTRHIYPDSVLRTFTQCAPKCVPHWMQNASFLYDESLWGQRVSQHLNLEQHCLFSPKFNLDRLIGQYAEWLGGCTEVLFPLLNNETYSLAKTYKLKTVLSGFGGDEVVSQHANSTLTELRAQKAYGRYFYERALKKYRNSCSGSRRTFLNVNHHSKQQQPNSHWLYLFLASGCTPKIAPLFETVRSKEAAYVQGELSVHWQRRIEVSRVIAKHYDINYAFPLADPALMNFFHQLPAQFKRRHGYGRYLFRKVTENYLPHSVAWRCDKAGATAPAAYSQLVEQLPQCFLRRVHPGYRGVLKKLVDLPKLCQLFQCGPTLDDNVIRLSIMILMLMHYEAKLGLGAC